MSKLDIITINKIIVEEVIRFLKQGNYVRCTDMYCGSYWDGTRSEDRYKISKDNIYFITMTEVRTVTKKVLNLKKFIISIEIEGEKQNIPVWIAIDVDDWKIYLKL